MLWWVWIFVLFEAGIEAGIWWPLSKTSVGENPWILSHLFYMALIDWLCDGVHMLAVSSAPHFCWYVWCTHNSGTFRFGTSCFSRQAKCSSFFGSAICDTGSTNLFQNGLCPCSGMCSYFSILLTPIYPLFDRIWTLRALSILSVGGLQIGLSYRVYRFCCFAIEIYTGFVDVSLS